MTLGRNVGVSAVLVISIVLGALAPAAAQETESPTTVAPTTSQPGESIPGLGNIIGSPDPGPKPEDAGDRGGFAQLGLAVVMLGGVGFILQKIFREVRTVHE